jgi:hypothetical protein
MIDLTNKRYIRNPDGLIYEEGVDFLVDSNNNLLFPGDYVTFEFGKRNFNRRVLYIDNSSVYVRSSYGNGTEGIILPFARLQARFHPYHYNWTKDMRGPTDFYHTPAERKAKTMCVKETSTKASPNKDAVCVAYRVPESKSINDLVTRIDSHAIQSSLFVIADTSIVSLKRRVKTRITAYPNEQWIIAVGHNVMEVEQAEVNVITRVW